MNKFQWLSLLCIGLLLLFYLGAYRGLFSTFYQQDEWQTLGLITAAGSFFSYVRLIPLGYLLTGIGRPLSIPFQYGMFKFFPYQITPMALFSLVMHGVNAVLLYLLTRKYFGTRLVTIVPFALFLVSSTSSQALTWFATNTTTLPSLTFILLAFLFVEKARETTKTNYVMLAQVSALAAYLFKESAAVMIILLPLYYSIRIRKVTIVRLVNLFIPSVLYLLFVIGIRIYLVMTPKFTEGVFVSMKGAPVIRIILHALWYPLVSFSQLFIPQTIMIKLAYSFQGILYDFVTGSSIQPLVNLVIITDMLSILCTCIFCASIAVIAHTRHRNPLLFFYFLYTLMSFVPFAVVERGSGYLDSRYFYIGVSGWSILCGFIIDNLIRVKTVAWRTLGIIGSIGFVAVTVLYSSRLIRRDITNLSYQAKERKDLLSSLSALYPVPPSSPVFYISGNIDGYYLIPSLKVPFQQGPGFTLMVWYANTGRIPKSFITDLFLWGVSEQGYKEYNGSGFGYFYSKSELKKAITEYKLTAGQLVGLYYDTQKRTLTDISNEIRDEMF